MLEIIEYKDIKKYKRYFTSDLNNNSKLYFDKDIIHKIPYVVNNNFIQILEYIDNLNLNSLIELKKLIYKQENLIGYSFKNYKEYKSLRKFKNRDFEIKKADCQKIIYAFDLLSRHNLKYSDFHRGNVLINSITNDIKICDIDGISLVEDNQLMKNQLKCSIILSLAYLYCINYYDVRNVFNARGINDSNNQINRFCKNIDCLTIEDAMSLIDELDFNLIPVERKEIVYKSKELCKTGYYLYRRF